MKDTLPQEILNWMQSQGRRYGYTLTTIRAAIGKKEHSRGDVEDALIVLLQQEKVRLEKRVPGGMLRGGHPELWFLP